MSAIIILAVGLLVIGSAQAQVGSSISADGSAPNDNAMLDVKSPTTGAGKGILIPRITQAQRTTASASLAGGLLNSAGELRGGAAQGLIVYQTDGSQGLYFNTSQIATPAWIYLGASTTNSLPLTGGTMSGALNMGGQIVSNVVSIDFSASGVTIGRAANGNPDGVAVGYAAYGATYGAAVGYEANGATYGAAVGEGANGFSYGAAMGSLANGANSGAAVGYLANGTNSGAAVGREANGSDKGAAMGAEANGYNYGAAVGNHAKGTNFGAATGYYANGDNFGVAVGYHAKGWCYSAAVGYLARGTNYGVAVGCQANGAEYGAAMGTYSMGANDGAAMGYYANGEYSGAAVGFRAKGTNSGAAMGAEANGSMTGVAVGAYAKGNNRGVAVGYDANGAQTNVAIGYQANAQGGTERIAIGHNVTNDIPNSARLRGHLYLDGGTGLWYRTSFGEGIWTAKAFEIDHPLDPANKILRHYCVEGPQVWNVYAGNVQLVNGFAVVQLPDYYSALNLVGSEIYSLTPVGGWAPLWVNNKVADNKFVIAGQADLEVSWTIKVLRNDPGCLEDLRRRPVEQMKNEISNSRTAE